jgi:hypothetical protein
VCVEKCIVQWSVKESGRPGPPLRSGGGEIIGRVVGATLLANFFLRCDPLSLHDERVGCF